jgi:cytidyltransferase-like protein
MMNQMSTKIKTYEQVALLVKHSKESFIVKTGCFDILHIGHLKMFERCKNIADNLIVFIGSDEVLMQLYSGSQKAKAYFDENNRAEMVASLKCVDYVCILTEPTHHKALEVIRPQFYHISNDDRWPKEKQKMCDDLGIELVIDRNTDIINHWVLFEPHSTEIKNDKFTSSIT